MTDKASPAGWVIQITVPAPVAADGSARWIGAVALSAPSFQYFNVAIADSVKAVEATRKHASASKEAVLATVRPLSSVEIASIPLKAGEVKPA